MKEKGTLILILIFMTLFCASWLSAFDQNRAGEILLKSLSIKEGKLSFGTDTGGCTSKSSFRVDIEPGKDSSGEMKTYTLTIKRVRPDDCKGFFPEGIVIEYEIGKDLGIKGSYTISVKNRILPE